jgi:hypothetical protein
MNVFTYFKNNSNFYKEGSTIVRQGMQRHVEELSLRYEFDTLYKTLPDIFILLLNKESDSAARDHFK